MDQQPAPPPAPSPAPAPAPTVGRIVHYRVGGTDETPDVRPAMVVRVWSATCVQLQVFLDGSNDAHRTIVSGSGEPVPMFTGHETLRGLAWRTSVALGDSVGEWRWPARS